MLRARTKFVSCLDIRGAELPVVHYPPERCATVDRKKAFEWLLVALAHILEHRIGGQDARDRAKTHPLAGMG